MTNSWLIVLGEFVVLFICLHWYLRHTRERNFAVRIEHGSIEGMTLKQVEELINRPFVVSEILLADRSKNLFHPDENTVLHHGDHLLIRAHKEEIEPIIAFLGRPDNLKWKK